MTENQKKSNAYLIKLKAYRQMHYKSLDRIDALRFGCLPGAIRYDVDRVQSSPTNKMESLLIASIDAENKLITRHQEYIRKVRIVEDICRNLPDDERELIQLYYLMDWKFAEISNYMNKSESTIYRIKNNALEHFIQYVVVNV